MKPTSPPDTDALGVNWLPVLQQRCHGRALRGVAVQWDPIPLFIFSMPWASKIKKMTACHHLISAKPRCSEISRESLSSCKPGWPTPSTHRASMALPFPLSPANRCGPTHRDVPTWLRFGFAKHPQPCWKAGVEPSWLLRENFARVISSSVVPTAKIQSIEAEGFKICIHTKMNWLFYRIIIVV